MKHLLRALLLSLVLVPLANAHFRLAQIWVVDQNGNNIYFVAQNYTWKLIIESRHGLNGPTNVTFKNYGLHGVDMAVTNAAGDEVIELYECNGGTQICTRVVLDSSDGLLAPGGPNGLALDGRNHIYVANRGKSEILRYDEDYTNPMLWADASDGLVDPSGMTFLANGDMVVANAGSGGEVLRLDRNGNASLFDVITGQDPYSVVLRPNTDLYVACNSGAVYRYPASDPTRRKFLGTYGGANPCLAFDLSGRTLYHVNRGDGMLRTIKPVKGTATIRIDQGWDSAAIQLVESQWPPGSMIPIVATVPGTGGFEPTFYGTGDLRPGQPINLELRDFVGGAPSFFMLGVGRGSTTWFQIELAVDPTQPYWTWPMVLPGVPGMGGQGDLDLAFVVPNDPALALTSLYAQHFAFDPGAVEGISASNGLRFYFGQ